MFYFLLFISILTVFGADNNAKLLQIPQDVIETLRLKPDTLSKSVSYVDFELLNGYQCAIECIKEKTSCTGYSFDAINKICSLYADLSRSIDTNVTKLRESLKPKVCDNVRCKPGAICVEHEKQGKRVGVCMCLNGQNTPDDCDKIDIGTWAEYSGWSACSVTCGEGYRFRKRDCLSSTEKNRKMAADSCIGKDIEIEPCDVTSCPIYGPWGSWSPCSTFCGIGVKQRNRSCIPPGSNCGNYTQEQRACGEAHCQRVVGIRQTEPEKYPLKGYLSIREGDILCIPPNRTEMAKKMADLVCKSIGLNRGAQYAILTPVLRNSTCYPGIICDGTETYFHECKYDRSQVSKNVSDLQAIITRCIVDGDFSHWSEWSPCTKSCGTGETSRSRTCSEPAPSIPEPGAAAGDDLSIAGLNCTGDYTQVKPCNIHAC